MMEKFILVVHSPRSLEFHLTTSLTGITSSNRYRNFPYNSTTFLASLFTHFRKIDKFHHLLTPLVVRSRLPYAWSRRGSSESERILLHAGSYLRWWLLFHSWVHSSE